jgi:hypothetical protein
MEAQAACAALEAAGADAYPARSAKVCAGGSAGKSAAEVSPSHAAEAASAAAKAAAMTAAAAAAMTAAATAAASEGVCLNRRHAQGDNRKNDTDFAQHDDLHYGRHTSVFLF